MARTPWKCPYPDCKQESNRHGNLMRHINRLHGGYGRPVKNKTSADTELLARQEQKAKGENDFIDTLYATYKKYKDRYDKVQEMHDFFNANNSGMSAPPFRYPLNIPDYNELGNTPKRQYEQLEELANVIIRGLSNLLTRPPNATEVNIARPKIVIGYVAQICRNCLESESLQVIYDPNTKGVSRSEHLCDPHMADLVRRSPTFISQDILFGRVVTLSKEITKTVKDWAKGNEVFMIVHKLDTCSVTSKTITINNAKDIYEWLRRGILEKHTTLNEAELDEFFRLTDYITFCHLYILEDHQQTRMQGHYALYLNYKPCFPFWN